MSNQIALLRIGYQDYAVPIDAAMLILQSVRGLRKVESRYEKSAYVYWYSADSELIDTITLLDASRIHDSDPGKSAPPAPVAPVTPPDPADKRVLAAPGDMPIAIKSVPPTRDFVDEWRDE